MQRRVSLKHVSFPTAAPLPPSSSRNSRSHTSPGELLELGSLRFLLNQQDLHLDLETFARLLQTCGKLKALSEGKRVHALISNRGPELDVFVANLILVMYGKCASVKDAKRTFDQIRQLDVVSWTAMIGMYAKDGHCKEALHFFQRMQVEGVNPNKVTFITVLNACNVPDGLVHCKMVHASMVPCGFESDVSVGNALITSYTKCRSIVDAHEVFENMRDRNVVSWTSMIGAFVEWGDLKKALQLFDQMHVEGVNPNTVTFITILNACSSPTTILEGKMIHAVVAVTGAGLDVVVGCALINMYGKCGSLENARRIFNEMPQRNVITWNAMIGSYVHHGFCNAAFQLFAQMQQEGMEPDKISLTTVLNQCVSDLKDGKMIHAISVNIGLESDEVVGCALINMYGKCGSVVDAHRVFSELQKRNVISWTSLIAGHARAGYTKEAVQLVQQMEQEGVEANVVTFVSLVSACGSTSAAAGHMIHGQVIESGFDGEVAVGTALVSMYGRFGDVVAAQKMFDKMHDRNVVSWNAMMAVYSQHTYGSKVFELLQMMQLEGVEPNNITFMIVLSGCAQLTLLEPGRKAHASAVKSELESDTLVASALLSMYGKCEDVKDAQRIFDRLHERNLSTWNGIISAYALHGHSQEVLENFQRMQLEGVKPNEITFITMLHACASFEALQEGKIIHALILQVGFEADLTLGNALVNIYGNCGGIREAQRSFSTMPERDVASWNAMIGVYARNVHEREAFELFQ